MPAVRIQLNRAAVRDLLRSPGVRADLERRARNIARAAGPGHEVESFVGRNRARATARTATPEAMASEKFHKTLTRALPAGRA